MHKTKVAVVTGGKGAELEISLASAKVVSENLSDKEFDVYQVNITVAPWSVSTGGKEIGIIDMDTFQCNTKGDTLKFDVVFMAIHGTPAEDGKLQGYFDLLKIPYTCCSVLASAITFDKDVCKQILQNVDVKQARSILLTAAQPDWHNDFMMAALEFPLFVKPNKNGSSYGVSKVNALMELEEAVSKALYYDDEVLVEEFINGRELACGVFSQNNEITTLPVTEIISENEFFDYEAKYLGKSKEITPADITADQNKNIADVTKTIYKVLKLTGACRVDYFLQNDELFLLEVNTIPGLSKESLLPQQAEAQGYSLSEFFGLLIHETLRQSIN